MHATAWLHSIEEACLRIDSTVLSELTWASKQSQVEPKVLAEQASHESRACVPALSGWDS